MNSFIRWLLGAERRRRERFPDYEPRHWGVAELNDVEVSGRSLAAANHRYVAATLDYPMGPEGYRSIALDRTHRVKLVSRDSDFVAHRSRGHRYEPVYRIAVYLNLGTDAVPAYGSPQLARVLASEFDRWMAESGAAAVA